MRTRPGIEILCESPGRWPLTGRLGLLANPASVDGHLRHARDLLRETFPGRLTALFSPQHGFFAEKQDNMVESAGFTDPDLGIPVFSLYGDTRIPTPEMMDAIDTLVIDLQDAGTRVYTFIYTLSYCMEAARDHGKPVVVLDRPNPINGITMEGNLLAPEWASFVGRYPLPMRHGLTIGELARLFNDRFGIGCDLTVVPMAHWQRSMRFADTGLPWVAPSPNLPTPDSALVYPGQVIWEGTNISEGRGTTRPFEYFGAPFLDTHAVAARIQPEFLKGVVLRPMVFEPTSSKWQGVPCQGFQIHPVAPDHYRSYTLSLALLQVVINIHGDAFAWKPPPYEYEHERMPIDLILGDGNLRKRIEQQEEIFALEQEWHDDLESFKTLSKNFHLYT
ncbi:exo-beta-N-acetylmuramidase NamZ family protein [Desulfosudis oleivorans]|uniref:DUF1343 domain-containing protein n=1 Tax=Desulfosudis oleivorans (strain DSM 6200 / JCM 39069 / Hxd3) TaxID=96561 RepID=A8ZTA5_DESOH|nr:DUF1343 domain-containing protein [Desulfosudis oleivorans]ABW67788.1 conserved hypothetical protein [Desulfosudis oleivorans Hxd3]